MASERTNKLMEIMESALAEKIRSMLSTYEEEDMEPEDAYQAVADELGIDVEQLQDVLSGESIKQPVDTASWELDRLRAEGAYDHGRDGWN